jgi:hypothetical protein
MISGEEDRKSRTRRKHKEFLWGNFFGNMHLKYRETDGRITLE